MTNSDVRRRPTMTPTVAALTMAGVIALAGCGRDDAAAPAGATPSAGTPTQTAGDGRSAGPAAVYKEVASPCAVVVPSALEQLVGPAGKKLQERAKPSMTCQLNVGASPKVGLLDVQMEIADFAEGQYHGMRGAQEKQTTVTDVPGLGQGAYSYADKLTGPHVVALDGNLHLTVRWAPYDSVAVPQADVIKALTEVARQTMSKLQAA